MRILFDTHDNKVVHLNRISGPISFRLLVPYKPTNRKYVTPEFAYIIKKLPVVLLLGDYHKYSNFRCPNCICNDDLSECCFEIYKDQLFQLLDIASVKEQKNITVCIQSSMIEQFTDNQLKPVLENKEKLNKYKQGLNKDRHSMSVLYNDNYNVLNKMLHNFRPCFQSNIKRKFASVYEQLCQAPNLRWDLSDPRSISIFSQTETFKLEALVQNAWSVNIFGSLFVPKCKELGLTLNKQFVDELIVQRCLYYFFKSTDELKCFCLMMKYMYTFIQSHKFVDYMFDDEHNLVNKMSMILKYNKSNDWKVFYQSVYVIKNILQFLYDRINKHFQLDEQVSKIQIEKWQAYQQQINDIGKTFALFFELMYKYLDQNQSQESFDALHTYIVSTLYPLFDCTKFLSGINYYYPNWTVGIPLPLAVVDADMYVSFYKSLSLNEVHTMITSCFLDLYFIVRLIKNQDTDMLLLCAGDEHCSFLTEVFTTYFGYYQSATAIRPINVDGNPDRCINLDDIHTSDIHIRDLLSQTNVLPS